jgi:hypothetical protein
MPTLKVLKESTSNYLRVNDGTSEFDQSINDISRLTIKAMKKEYGTCYLGKINLYGDERKEKYKLVEYTGQTIYNFDFCFCIPVYDEEIETLIDNRDKAPYTDTKGDIELINHILKRIVELNGINLFWS